LKLLEGIIWVHAVASQRNSSLFCAPFPTQIEEEMQKKEYVHHKVKYIFGVLCNFDF